MAKPASTWHLFPDELPGTLMNLQETLAWFIGPPSPFESLGELRSSDEPIVLVVAEQASANLIVEWLAGVRTDAEMDIVAIVPDGYLGTDGGDRVLAASGASVVSSIRSLAGTRGTTVRANAVAIPDAMVGAAGEMSGPLAHATSVEDVAEVVSFLLNADNGYISGQVIYADGGRHLFSSHTS
jgi:Enoyl-(Acyl carrier protein) reductase